MIVTIQNNSLDNFKNKIIPIYEDQKESNKVLELLKSNETFLGKEEEIFYFTNQSEEMQYTILVGLGKKSEVTSEIIRNAIAKGVKRAKDLKLKSFQVELMANDIVCIEERITAIAEGIYLSLYKFDRYKSDKKDYEPEIIISNVPQEKLEKAMLILDEIKTVIEGTIIARNLVNEPSNTIYPETLAKKVIELSKEYSFEVEVLDENQAKALGMEAFLAVGMGSENMPRLIIMRYMGDKDSNEILGLVGKGLTYDTGGYSLKPTTSMDTMKSDMGGAAAVIGLMTTLNKNKIKKNIVAVVAACENAISGRSYKPGDIIGSMAGKTIEVLNTDAEGRLTLADAVTYIIEKEKATKIIDIATLTGAVLVALGTSTTGVITNNDEFYDELITASNQTGEQFWKLPTFKEYKKQIKGNLADLKNTGGRYAGTITAGLFVGEFVQDKPWIHLDIAGTSWAEADEGYIQKGGTGVPVRTLYHLIKM